MKIVIDKDIPFIQDRFPAEIETVYVAGAEIDKKLVEDADALIVRTRTKCDEHLLKGTKVKMIVTATIGTDHIDIPWCEVNGITVRSAPGCNAPGVAQYVLSSLFKAGFNPKTDTLGIIGYGNVGSIVADWARQCGIRLLISDAPREEAGYTDVEYVSKDRILKECDAVTLHVPLTSSGHHPTLGLIGEEELGKIKPDALLINSSRGGVVEEKALKEMLLHHRIRAVIDVWENEPDIDYELAKKAFIATPHIAGYSLEGKMRATAMALEAVGEVLGFPVDTKGLECKDPKDFKITRERIENSYNPFTDHSRLLSREKGFEELRNKYSYRNEP